MKPVKVLLLLLVITFLDLSSANAFHPPRGREATGIVERVDPKTRLIVVLIDNSGKDSPKELQLKWTTRTSANVDGKPAKFADLQLGTRVYFRYVATIFEGRILRKIAWSASQ